MTVAELIEELKKQPQDAIVVADESLYPEKIHGVYFRTDDYYFDVEADSTGVVQIS